MNTRVRLASRIQFSNEQKVPIQNMVTQTKTLEEPLFQKNNISLQNNQNVTVGHDKMLCDNLYLFTKARNSQNHTNPSKIVSLHCGLEVLDLCHYLKETLHI